MVEFTQKQICELVSLKPRQVGFLTERMGIIPRVRSESRGVPNKYDDFNLFQFFNAAEMYRFQMPIMQIVSAMVYLKALKIEDPSNTFKGLPRMKSFFPKIKQGTFLSIRPTKDSPVKKLKYVLDIRHGEDTNPSELYNELCKQKDQRSLFVIDLFKTQEATLACL